MHLQLLRTVYLTTNSKQTNTHTRVLWIVVQDKKITGDNIVAVFVCALLWQASSIESKQYGTWNLRHQGYSLGMQKEQSSQAWSASSCCSILVLQACKSIQTIICQHLSDYQVTVAVSLRAQGDHFPHVAHASVTGFASRRSMNIAVEDRAIRYNRNIVAI